MFDDDFDMTDAMLLGTGYAFYRYGQDRQTEQIARIAQALANHPPLDLTREDPTEEPVEPAVNALDLTDEATLLESWEDFIGQTPLKTRMQVHVQAAKIRDERLPHTLFASGYAGVGKTTVARLCAEAMSVRMIEMVPPFKIDAIIRATQQLQDKDILFIDEIHKLTDGVGTRGAEVLLKVLEEHWAPMPDGSATILPDITVIGATTDKDKLPDTVIDRFKIKPYFQAYTLEELVRIAIQFAYRHRAEAYVSNPLAIAISKACRGTPRVIEEMVTGARDLAEALGQSPSTTDLLEFLEVEPDGLTRTHVHYLCSLRQYFAREAKDGSVEYISGEAALQQICRETKEGIGRIERFLVERGLIDKTPRGRRLTELGIQRAEALIAIGKGVSDV